MEKECLKGIYHLVTTDLGGNREYFNFVGRRRFLCREFVTQSGVKLAAIDALTCLFKDEKDFKATLNDGTLEYDKDIKIVYKNKEEKTLDPVYDNDELRTIANRAIEKNGGSYIDEYDHTTRLALDRIFKEIQNRGSNFSYEVINSDKLNHQLNNHSKDAVTEFHNNTAYTERNYNYQFRIFAGQFKSYKEFRALYLAYKDYKKSLYKMEVVSKPYDKEKTLKKLDVNKPTEGQISMFDLL